MAEQNTYTLPSRDEIDARYKWKLEDIYPSDEQWEQDFAEARAMVEKFSQYRGQVTASADKLLEAIRAYEQINQRLEKLYVYARMRSDEDQTVTKYQAMSDRAQGLSVQANSAMAFFVPEILSLDEQRLEQFFQERPDLRLYDFFLQEILREKPHRRTPEEEEIIAMAGELAQAPTNIYSILNNAEIRFPTIRDEQGQEVELTKARFLTFMESPDRRVRRDAFNAMYETYGSFRHTLAASLNAGVKQEIFFARVRRFGSALEAALHPDHVPVEVYHSLIDTIHEHLPLLHRYMELRKKLLKLDELHMYDLYVPLVENVEMKIPYEKALELVKEGLHPLGEEYQQLLEEAFASGWIDVYENRGKRGGAYSWGAYGTHPYVLLNYQENLDNVFTIAHEMGHALHSYYSDREQPYIYSQYTIFVAEVASTLNEALLMDYLMKRTEDPKQKMVLVNHYLEQFRGTVFRQVKFAEFEKIIHEKVEAGEALTADLLCEIYLDLNKTYYGPAMVVDEEIAVEWARIPHFYSNFYVYKYATGFSAAQALANKILTEGAPAVARYLEFLKGGGSDTPINLLKRAGVDMTKPEPVREAMRTFGRLLDQLEELAEKQTS
ncbi:MAG: oligoendopeptidase F [Bacillus thermozeamaize]|uniref:Oligopeptidase F n=1 Tax=Bacillus thermozeamaize TaxID=230954 RepID=A0A1Y3PFJ5_9BACI|nr:MAG: oligoendopeptidase F [Bacillus thermozeamaize]